MGRLIRNTAILVKIESVYGTDAVPTGVANAMLVSNLSINPLNAQNVSRDLIRPYLGGSEELVGTAFTELGFDVEIAGSGAAGTAPAWGPLLRSAGFAETITVGNRVEYTLLTDPLEGATVYWYDSGVLHKGLGGRNALEIELNVGDRPKFKNKLIAMDGGISAAANPSVTLTGWQKPLVVTDANTGDITLGCTYSAGALSGGVVYPSRGITLNLGNMVNHTPMLGGESVELSNRDVVGNVQFELTAAQEVAFMATVKANTTQSLGVVHGTTAGNKVLIHAPAVQLINPSKQEINGKRLIGFDLRLVPVSGNDDIRIVSL